MDERQSSTSTKSQRPCFSSKAINRWASMMARCYDPDNANFPRYGGRGISVCERWHVFQNFYDDFGEIQSGLSLDRIDNDGDFEPSNIRLANATQQANNTSRNVNLTLNNKTQTIAQWSRDTTDEEVLTFPVTGIVKVLTCGRGSSTFRTKLCMTIFTKDGQ